MSISAINSETLRATHEEVTEDTLTAELNDGRTISVPVAVPVAWYPRLQEATAVERENFRLIGGGEGVHWPDLDEDASIENVLRGHPSGESAKSLGRWLESWPRQDIRA